jgi:DNA-binding PadR family transcriptional regulator
MEKVIMFAISNVEFMVLALIHENGKISGYRLNTLVQERGYREWADIGTTSIYAGLKKLKQKGYVTSATDRGKKGKGPKGTNYMLTPDGLALLKAEVVQGLAQTRERDRKFDLAVSVLEVLAPAQILEALAQRKTYLHQEFERIQQKYETQQAHLALSAKLLFRHPLTLIKSEITFIDEMIAEVSKVS